MSLVWHTNRIPVKSAMLPMVSILPLLVVLTSDRLDELVDRFRNVFSNSAVTFTSERQAELMFESDACRSTADEINYLEHVEVVVTVEYPIRGRLEIELISPSGIFDDETVQRYAHQSSYSPT